MPVLYTGSAVPKGYIPESGPVAKNETKNLNIRQSIRDYRYLACSINFVTTLLQLYNRNQLIFNNVSYYENFTAILSAALLADHQSTWHSPSCCTCVAFSSAVK